ncbi:mating alpha-pheromone PpgA [Aspergillus affinis]|uniref:mating alpha-pheromone PpgA n=1 Tax=Aspergillus affinis TaxID=1070780 RepID=UPI0022FEB2A6|nr:uncharacterized protein KD926_009930 [Aspergillus affinis]KAI9039062.1 hypothetical protein KD926_009930 [Aspergillus affinis]
MKLITFVLATLAATTVQAGTLQKWCHLPGQPCAMLKRAADATGEVRRSADALAEAMADASPEAIRVKRAADVVNEFKRSADALAEAMAAIDED